MNIGMRKSVVSHFTEMGVIRNTISETNSVSAGVKDIHTYLLLLSGDEDITKARSCFTETPIYTFAPFG